MTTIETFHSEQFRVGPKDDPDRYRLGLPVGAGAEGTLYRGSLTIDQGLVLEVAIKMLHPHHRPNLALWRRRWTDQIELLRTLRAPGLVAVRDGFVGALPHVADEAADAADTLYLVMNFVEGTAIDSWAADHPDVPDRDKLRLLLPVAAGLDLMHSGAATGGTPVIHGDVKPGNIIVTEGGGTILVDFGMMRSLPGGTRQTSVGGTPSYLAPEVIADGVYTPGADRFGFGGVAYYLLTGRHPTRDGAEMRDALEAGGRNPEMVDHVLEMFLPADERPRSLANWCAQLRDSSLEATHSPGTLAPPAPARRSPGTLPTAAPARPGRHREGGRAPAGGGRGSPARALRPVGAALLVLLLAVGVAAARAGRPAAVPRAVFAFAPAVYSNGLVVSREWSLTGRRAERLHARLRVTNGAQVRVSGTVDEVVTKAVAPRITSIGFRPDPDVVVSTDPIVVRYAVRGLESLHAVEFTYEVPIASVPAERSRLEAWAAAQAVEEAGYRRESPGPAPAMLVTLTVVPPALSLPVGQSYQLSPAGGMSDGTPASALVLSGVAWTTSDPVVVGVVGGKVTANRAGTAKVSAQAGTLRAETGVTATATTTVSSSSEPSLPPVTFEPPSITLDPTPASSGASLPDESQPPSRSLLTQAVLFAPPSTAVAATSATLSATGGASNRPVYFSVDASSGAGVCEVSGADGSTVRYMIAGSCVINADQAGDAAYAAAPRVQRTILVELAPQTIDFPLPGGGVVGGDGSLSAAGGASGLPVVFSVDGPAAEVCSISGSTVVYRQAGNCVINADQAGDAAYAAAPRVSRTVVVRKASQTVTFAPAASAAAGTTLTLSATGGESGHPVVFSVDATSGVGVCSASGVNGATLTLVAAGDCVVNADQAGDANYEPAPRVQRTIAVTGAAAMVADDSGSGFAFTGAWTATTAMTNLYQGTDHFSNGPGDSFEFSFTGTQAFWWGALGPDQGIAAVSVDGGPETLVDTYAAIRADGQLLYSTPVLLLGTHTLTVTVTGTKNTASTGVSVGVDYGTVLSGP